MAGTTRIRMNDRLQEEGGAPAPHPDGQRQEGDGHGHPHALPAGPDGVGASPLRRREPVADVAVRHREQRPLGGPPHHPADQHQRVGADGAHPDRRNGPEAGHQGEAPSSAPSDRRCGRGRYSRGHRAEEGGSSAAPAFRDFLRGPFPAGNPGPPARGKWPPGRSRRRRRPSRSRRRPGNDTGLSRRPCRRAHRLS